MVLLHQTGGLPKLQIRNLLNDISLTTDQNSKKNHRIVPHDALYQDFTNGFTPLFSHSQVCDPGPKGALVKNSCYIGFPLVHSQDHCLFGRCPYGKMHCREQFSQSASEYSVIILRYSLFTCKLVCGEYFELTACEYSANMWRT